MIRATGDEIPDFGPGTVKSGYQCTLSSLRIKGRTDIRRLKSVLSDLKLDVPYGEYRATYVQGFFHPFPFLVIGLITAGLRAGCAAGEHSGPERSSEFGA